MKDRIHYLLVSLLVSVVLTLGAVNFVYYKVRTPVLKQPAVQHEVVIAPIVQNIITYIKYLAGGGGGSNPKPPPAPPPN